MKLNKKGYLTVEVILASVIAITIAIFLMEITIRLVDITDDAYVDTKLITDKALIIKNIKNELEKDIEDLGGIYDIYEDRSVDGTIEYSIEFCDVASQDDYRTIFADNRNTNTIGYVRGDNYISGQYENIYNKQLNNYMTNINIQFIGNVNINNGYILFKITADNKFSKEPFTANVIVKNNRTC